MNNIYNLVSDWEIMDELADCIRNRSLDQKFLYFNNWAKWYYERASRNAFIDKLLSVNKLFEFGIKNNFNKWEKIAFISLWCGNSMIERNIFDAISEWYDLSYFWVDSSKGMLVLSEEEFKGLSNKKMFINADISTREFRSELNQLTASCDKRVFAFFSWTFSNINQTNVIDILYNLLNKWEKIWLDIRLRTGVTAKDDMVDFKRYHSWLSDDVKKKSYFNVLEWFWIPAENWKLVLATEKEKALNALQFKIYFQFNKKTEINIRWEKIIILPNETMKLQQIHNYDPDGLISFFEEHWMKFKDSMLVWNRWMFLFEKI